MASLSSSPRLAPLAHPGWWAALTLLVANDHWLKHAGLLPAALTGKLSDFAGLIVAPVLVAALIGARSLPSRAMAFAVCAIPFAAINLSPALAARWDALLGWSTTPDPSDLLALVVAPIALWLAGVDGLGNRIVLARSGIVVGALACVATSPGEPILSTNGGPALTNDTREEVVLRVRWIDAAVDCETLLAWTAEGWGGAELERALDPALFDLARTYRLAPNEVADLSRPDASSPGAGCDALVVSADDLGQRLVVYAHVSGGLWIGSELLNLEERRDGLILTSPTLDILHPQASVAPPTCDRGPDIHAFSWSGSAPREAIVVDYEPLSSSCFALVLADPSASGGSGVTDPEPWDPALPPLAVDVHRLTFCAPREQFRFAVGEEVEVISTTEYIAVESAEGGVSLEALTRMDPTDERTLCEGERLPCGGYVEPIAWAMPDGRRLLPGEARTEDLPFDGFARQRRTLLLDDARRVVVADDSCALETGLQGVLLTRWENER